MSVMDKNTVPPSMQLDYVAWNGRNYGMKCGQGGVVPDACRVGEKRSLQWEKKDSTKSESTTPVSINQQKTKKPPCIFKSIYFDILT